MFYINYLAKFLNLKPFPFDIHLSHKEGIDRVFFNTFDLSYEHYRKFNDPNKFIQATHYSWMGYTGSCVNIVM
jgi:hypothetical protein